MTPYVLAARDTLRLGTPPTRAGLLPLLTSIKVFTTYITISIYILVPILICGVVISVYKT